MMTNTYLPNVCGVSRSVESCSEALRARGHRTLVVAPARDDSIPDEPHVVRVPAIHNVTANDIPVRLPIPGYLWTTISEFQPDIVHAHHPFLLGNTALRLAATWRLPVVLTYHTMYEHYTHNLPVDSAPLERFTVRLATEFANQCDRVIAPSQSVREVLRSRGVRSPISVLPTGIDRLAFAGGDGHRSRARHGIPQTAFVVGHVGRLAPEKNLEFLTRAVCRYLRRRPAARYFVVGDGPLRDELPQLCVAAGVADRLHLSDGALSGQDLADAYAAMNVLAFASQSETQGMVLAEAMTAGLPVVALDGSGVRDIVRDGVNGRLLMDENEDQVAAALATIERSGQHDKHLARGVAETAAEFSLERTTAKLVRIYSAAKRDAARNACPRGMLPTMLQRVNEEYQLWSRIGHAMYDAAFGEDTPSQSSGTAK
jgi:glycosyltransferase involved in cell wall biosynthesis